jgi:hypothetical protein
MKMAQNVAHKKVSQEKYWKVASMYLVVFFFGVSCSRDNSVPSPNIPIVMGETGLIKMEDALNNASADFLQVINKVRGSVGTNGPGSKVIWSTKNDYKLGLFLSANHVYGVKTWTSLQEEFIDLSVINNGIFIGSQIPPSNGSIDLSKELIANFGLYHPTIAPNSTNTTILPKDDFYLGIIDNQRIIDNGLGNYPNLVQTSIPLRMYDPKNRTRDSQTWSVVESNEIVIALGYPQDIAKYPHGAISTGKVYSDTEATNIIESLNQNGDVEGTIPYNSEVEFLANIEAAPGMSGGGVFNADGQLLGIMVRATKWNGEPVLRVVRITYMKERIKNFYNSLAPSERVKIEPFVNGEVQ